jgi:predicted acetyltransferase
MDVELRAVTEDELVPFLLADSYGFGFRWDVDDGGAWPRVEMDRTVAAVVDGEIVATGRNYSLELTMPGVAVVPAGGVSWISTRPSHRRRGLLTCVMRHLIEESQARGEVASVLTASEGGIYPRFGYGVATRTATFEFPRPGTEFLAPVPAGATLRMVEPDVAQPIAAALFERIRRDRIGSVSRPDAWWGDEWASSEWIDAKRRFDVIVDIGGAPAGHAIYAIEGEYRDGFSHKVVAVRDLLAVSPDAELALWHFLAEVDQTVALRAWNRPLDDVLPWLLADARHVRTSGVRDFLWLRPIDTAALLGARTYGVEGVLTVAVADPSLGLDATAGTFTVDGGPDGATCRRTDAEPDVALDAAELGAIVLGGVRPSVLARAGRVHVASSDALARADAMFGTDREPYASTWF